MYAPVGIVAQLSARARVNVSRISPAHPDMSLDVAVVENINVAEMLLTRNLRNFAARDGGIDGADRVYGRGHFVRTTEKFTLVQVYASRNSDGR